MLQYRAIIFDGGGVIFTYSFDNTFKYWAEVGGKNINEIKSKFVFDETFKIFEKGQIDASTYRTHVLTMLGLNISNDEFDEGWNSIYLESVPGITQLLQGLRTKYRLVVLTNTNEIHTKKWKIMFASILNYFEKIFSSHEIHARKPERKAYETVLGHLQLNPDEVIFLDDNTEYIQAATRMNIASIHVRSFRQMVVELHKRGVEVKGII